jgi:hypothetical protein
VDGYRKNPGWKARNLFAKLAPRPRPPESGAAKRNPARDDALMPPSPAPMSVQIFWLLVLAIPIATIARTVVFEEVFVELRDWCRGKSERCDGMLARKFFYLFTCEYCFSHWVTLVFLPLTRFKLLIDDWRGYVIAWFALVFVANVYLNLYSRLRVDITSEKKKIEQIEQEIENEGGKKQPRS